MTELVIAAIGLCLAASGFLIGWQSHYAVTLWREAVRRPPLPAAVDIVEVIGSRIPLVRIGVEFAAHCPFHEEQSRSFTVSPHGQFFHCFGCGAHGTALDFVRQFDLARRPSRTTH